MKQVILLTGANGFVGTQIARRLLQNKENSILALVRAVDADEGARRLARNWWDWQELVEEIGNRVKVVCGDVCSPRLGLKESDYDSLVENVTHIIHTAADWRLVSLEEIRKTNVQGTANVIEVARKASKHHHFERFSHISTAYVAGGRTGAVSETELTDEFGFLTNYEQSKYEGELLVQAAKTEFPVSIFRPSMVVGDSQTGAIKTFNTFYYPLKLYLTGKRRFVPVSRSLRLNVIPVDYVAEAVTKLTFNPKAIGLTFHLVAPSKSLLTVGELLSYVKEWAEAELGVKLSRPVFVPMSASFMKAILRLQQVFLRKNRRETDALTSLAPYFSENRQFGRTNTDKLLGAYNPRWIEILPRLLEYAVYNSFFHRSDRTVHEQALFRLESRSYPITYYDLIEDQIVKKTAAEMRHDILAAVSSLRSFGVKEGDRVALTGVNSTRYLAVDLAIGLLGAISVPLYYTAPPADINDILLSSGSKICFLGMPSLLSRAEEFTAVPIISLCRGPIPQNLHRKVETWEEFLSRGATASSAVKAPAGFGDIATLRYSSGTTGKPKGSIFKHYNLRYMAESIVSIMPWRERNQKGCYLSFLPMGHVVEGILATYSPYYVPAPVEIYFLEDFRKLQTELPRIKPNIFFAVPRIYERIWEALGKNPFGRFYIRTKSHLMKRVLRRTLKNLTLKRAGLNRCAQLIAGSASCDEGLLQNYRELGVEIHNAYGLTEAPLVTINRLGKNRIGTVGEPMPFTEIKLAEDGEIMVKGPQVTAGYFDESLEPPIKNGWLMTGDIGKLTDEGSLVIFGRKKELVKTSYGKCIYSGKIEGMIRELPEVTEAMLVGESKPYCSALAWIDKKHYTQPTLEIIDKAMEEMNKNLSNPERIKKWALLVNNLSIENGELTPNLKLKRIVIFQKYAKIIDSLYTEAAPEGEVHIGKAEKTGE